MTVKKTDHFCTLCHKGTFIAVWDDTTKKLISITCNECGFMIAPVNRSNND